MNLRKLVQKKFLNFLANRWGMAVCVLGLLLCINTSFSIVQLVLKMTTLSLVARDWSDNLASRSFQTELCSSEIDIVYTWVNGSDPRLLNALRTARLEMGEDLKNKCNRNNTTAQNTSAPSLERTNSTVPEAASNNTEDPNKNCFGDSDSLSRFIDNEDLRYSLRSVERHAPWVRNIYVVTNGQIPYWLDLSHPRLHIITHDMIFVNKSHLPTFSSPAIEAHLHRIPGLSSKFLYLNDDTLFGVDVWPDDFVTAAKGQKVYLAWPVPDCSEGCPASWISDGYCDRACNVSACNWDGGDCANATSATSGSTFGGNWNSGWAGAWGSADHCAAGCPDSWIGDKYCDRPCQNLDCGMDAGDCGIEAVYENLYGIQLANDTDEIDVPANVTAMYIALGSVVGSARIADGSHDNAAIVRTATISQKHKTMTLTFHRNRTRQAVAISITAMLSEDRKLEITFNLTAGGLADGGPGQSGGNASALTNTTLLSGASEPAQSSLSDAPNVAAQASETLQEPTTQGRRRKLLSQEPLDEVQSIKQRKEEERLLYEYQKQEQMAKLQDFMHTIPAGTTLFPWERAESRGSWEKTRHGRRLLDAFGDSLRHVNGLLDKEFGVEARKVIAHMPHMIDRTIMEELQARWPEQFDRTSSHKFRQGDDMQYAFSYFYFLMRQRNSYTIRDIWDRLDIDHSGYLEENELRTIAVRIYGTPLRTSELRKLKHSLRTRCQVNASSEEQSPLPVSSATDNSTLNSSVPSPSGPTVLSNSLPTPSPILHTSQTAAVTPTPLPHASLDAIGSNQTVPSASPSAALTAQLPHTNRRSAPAFRSRKGWGDILSEKTSKDTVEESNEQSTSGNEEDDMAASLDDLMACAEIMEKIHAWFLKRPRNKFEVLGTDDVAFVMIHTNATTTQDKLDGIREKPRKFVCVNDDIDHTKEESRATLGVIRQFYDSLFPLPSTFELPADSPNPYLYWEEHLIVVNSEWQRRTAWWALAAIAASLCISVCAQRYVLRGRRQWTRDRRSREGRFLKLLRL